MSISVEAAISAISLTGALPRLHSGKPVWAWLEGAPSARTLLEAGVPIREFESSQSPTNERMDSAAPELPWRGVLLKDLFACLDDAPANEHTFRWMVAAHVLTERLMKAIRGGSCLMPVIRIVRQVPSVTRPGPGAESAFHALEMLLRGDSSAAAIHRDLSASTSEIVDEIINASALDDNLLALSDFLFSVVRVLAALAARNHYGPREPYDRLIREYYRGPSGVFSWVANVVACAVHPSRDKMSSDLEPELERTRPPSRFAYSETDRSALEFLVHMERLVDCTRQTSFIRESHELRAVEAGRRAASWLEAMCPLVVEVYYEPLGESLIGIVNEIATARILERLEAWYNESPFRRPAAIADMVLRAHGRAGGTQTSDAQLERDMLGPLEPIRGQTWLNDDGLERILYAGFSKGEENFATWYQTHGAIHETPVTYELFGTIQKLFAEVLDEAQKRVEQLGHGRRTRDKWEMSWSWRDVTPYKQEKRTGADVGIVFEVDDVPQLRWKRAVVIQVKAMNRTRRGDQSRWSSRWTIEAKEQLPTLIKYSDASFYLLLCPAAISSCQRVVPARTIYAMLDAGNQLKVGKPSVYDGVVAPCSHSLAHYLVYDLLAGWQGTDESRVVRFVQGDDFPGAPPTLLLDVKLMRDRPRRELRSSHDGK